MNQDLPAYVPGPMTDAESYGGAPVRPLTKAACLTSVPSLLVGGYFVVAVSISMLRGEEDEWGIGPFLLGLGLVLVIVAAAAMGMATLGLRIERRTARRSPWSVVGLGLAIIAAVPSGLILMLMR